MIERKIIPDWMKNLLDTLCKNTSADISPELRVRFYETIKPGVDLQSVKNPFIIFVLNHCKETVSRLALSDELKQEAIDVLDKSIVLYEPMIPNASFAYECACSSAAHTVHFAYCAAAYAAANVISATGYFIRANLDPIATDADASNCYGTG